MGLQHQQPIEDQRLDQLVVDVGQQLGRRLREGDVLARLEGDRLALLLVGVQLDNLFTIADGFRELAHQCHYVANGIRRYATVSVGVAIISRETPSAEYSLERARAASPVRNICSPG